LFNTYFAPVLSKPNFATIESIFGENDTGVSGYVVDVISSGDNAQTEVVDGSKQQAIPGKTEAHTNVWYDQGTSTATNGQGLGLATSAQAKFLKEAPLTTPKAY